MTELERAGLEALKRTVGDHVRHVCRTRTEIASSRPIEAFTYGLARGPAVASTSR